MTESIHAHSILEIILTSEAPLTRAEIQKTVMNRYGSGARFYSCSRSNMTVDETLEFLLSKSKVAESGGVLLPGSEGPCNHG